jgi:serine O-acetyltransferase
MANEKSFWSQIYRSHQQCPTCPSPKEVGDFFHSLLVTLFADFSDRKFPDEATFDIHIRNLRADLAKILGSQSGSVDARKLADDLFEKLPSIHEKIDEDVNAMFDGDPAAKSRSEVIRTYPGFYAIAAYRVAHQLHELGVREVPRIITEHAHSRTGIDIHPAARIGRHFCVDHGTGVVIGETAIIGDHVKIYQGVTLGALSVSKEDAERKRHPTIGDRVVVYAGATILGGETVIGHDSIIGGNVWLTKTVGPHSRIYYQSKMYNGHSGETDVVIFKSDKTSN